MAKKKSKKPAKKIAKKKATKKSPKPARTAGGKTVKKMAKKKTAKPAKKKTTKPALAKVPKTNSINTYLTFPGNCEDAFNFYKAVFGGDFSYIGRFKDMPPAEGQPPMSPEEGDKIMHVSLPISSETALMGSDSSDAYGHATTIGNNFSISINAKDQSEADRLYNGLAQDGISAMPMNKTFWGSYFGMLTDKYGINWMVSFDENQNK
jgi:PhnB protein